MAADHQEIRARSVGAQVLLFHLLSFSTFLPTQPVQVFLMGA